MSLDPGAGNLLYSPVQLLHLFEFPSSIRPNLKQGSKKSARISYINKIMLGARCHIIRVSYTYTTKHNAYNQNIQEFKLLKTCHQNSCQLSKLEEFSLWCYSSAILTRFVIVNQSKPGLLSNIDVYQVQHNMHVL